MNFRLNVDRCINKSLNNHTLHAAISSQVVHTSKSIANKKMPNRTTRHAQQSFRFRNKQFIAN